MKKILVYDIPTRLFHWIFATLFIGSFLIGKNVDDETSLFSYHMILGLTLGFAVLLRIVWGFVGSRYARFSSFSLKPSDLIGYFKSAFTSLTKRQLGHNPASSWAALVMMVWALVLGVTGYLMTNADMKESLEDIHELFANTFLLVAIGHILGILFHTYRHKDPIGLSMVTGEKKDGELTAGILRTYPLVGVTFVLLVGLFAGTLFSSFDVTTKRTKIFGQTLQLGEFESEKAEGKTVPLPDQQDDAGDDQKPTIDED